jgi:hypothetical protein
VRALVLWLGFVFAVATGVFYWAGGYSTGWAASLCRQTPDLCTNWQALAYAASLMLITYLALELWPR